MTDKFIEANGVRIRSESFGDPALEPLILIMGASAPGFIGKCRSSKNLSLRIGLWFAMTIEIRACLPVVTMRPTRTR